MTVTIEKDPVNPQIKWLCNIHLFEADYNFCLKLMGMNLVHKWENANIFGDQPRHSEGPSHQRKEKVNLQNIFHIF